jgi:hypothetical protein
MTLHRLVKFAAPAHVHLRDKDTQERGIFARFALAG